MGSYTGEVGRRLYVAAVAAADDCIHGQQGGDIIRPWTGTPACALCRRRHPVHWRDVNGGPGIEARPRNVVPINGSRKLW